VETLPVGGWLGEGWTCLFRKGLLVEVATSRGPAAAAGFAAVIASYKPAMRRIHIGGDVIVAYPTARKVAGQLDVNVVPQRKRPGDTVNVSVYRGGKRWTSPSARRTHRQLA